MFFIKCAFQLKKATTFQRIEYPRWRRFGNYFETKWDEAFQTMKVQDFLNIST